MSDVRVVVIDCTDTGASPPTATRADLDLPALAAVGELGRNVRHSERNRSHLLCIPKVWNKVPSSAGSGFEVTAPGRRSTPLGTHDDGSDTCCRPHRTPVAQILTGFTTSATSTSSVKQMKIPATT